MRRIPTLLDLQSPTTEIVNEAGESLQVISIHSDTVVVTKKADKYSSEFPLYTYDVNKLWVEDPDAHKCPGGCQWCNS